MSVKNYIKYSVAAAAVLFGSQAVAGIIIASADSNIESATNNTFFGNVFGGSDVFGRSGTADTWATTNWSDNVSSVANSYSNASSLTASNLIGMDWLVAGSSSFFAASELAVVTDFIDGGGNLWVVGEGVPWYSGVTSSGNQILSFLGSAMSFSLNAGSYDDTNDTGSATGINLLLSGAPNWIGDYAGEIFGGEALYTSASGRVLVATENLSKAVTVPEPASLALFGLGLAGLGFSRRKKA